MLTYVLAGTSLVVALSIMFYLAKNIKEGKKTLVISAIAIFFILIGITVGLRMTSPPREFSEILLFDTGILLFYILFLLFYNRIQKDKTKESAVKSTRRMSLLGLIIGIASVLMLMGFSVIPAAPYLKVEVSALIIFMTLLWFDLKTAIVVSLLTNIIHFFMPSSAPLIPMLDEMVNFLATMLFILPTALFLNKNRLNKEKKSYTIFILTIIGFVSTVVLMVLFNQYINLPLVYNIDMTFKEVILIFGLFNVIKWGINCLIINLTWRRFYVLRENL